MRSQLPRLYVMLLPCILGIFACTSEKPAARKLAAPQPPIIDKKLAPATVSDDGAWRQVLSDKIFDTKNGRGIGPFVESIDGRVLTLKIRNKTTFTEVAFQNFLVELVTSLAEAKPPFYQVSVETLGENQSLLLAKLSIEDGSHFQKQEISRPELIRRFGIRQDETVESLKVKALEAKRAGTASAAMDYLERWIAKEPSVLPLSLLGNLYRDEKRYFDAITVYEKILSLEPQSLFALHNLGYCYEKVGAYDDAILTYQKALTLVPQDSLLLKQLAEIQRKDGKFDDALKTIAAARAIGDGAELWLIEGNIQRDAKKSKEAKIAYENGLKLAPQDGRFSYNLLLLVLDAKQWDEAKKQYAELQKNFPDLAADLTTIMEGL